MSFSTINQADFSNIRKFLNQLNAEFQTIPNASARYQLLNSKDITLVFLKVASNVTFELIFKSDSFKISGSILDANSIKKVNILLDDYLPFPDCSTLITDQEAFDLMKKHGGSLPLRIESPQGNAYIISKETYDYFASKCLKHEAFDAQVLGASENFVKSSPVKITLKPQI